MPDLVCEIDCCDTVAVFIDDFGNHLCEYHAEEDVEGDHSFWEDYELIEDVE